MKISVIVPVYNAETFVSRCIDSILAQTYSDWELLLVDDGSKDGSLGVLNQYAQKDSRIQVFHQENAGAGMARNVGITHATGDYIVFVDSDDYVEKEYFSLIIEKNTDVVFIDVNQRNEVGVILSVEKLSVYASLPKDDILRNQMTGKMLWGGVRKAVRASIVKDNGILFSKHKVGEEAIYSFLVLYYAKNFSFIDKAVYNYIQRSDSLSHTLIDDPWGDVAVNLKAKTQELGVYEEYADTLNAFFVTAAIVSLDKMARKYGYCTFRQNANMRIKNLLIDNRFSVDHFHMLKKARFLETLLFDKSFILFYLLSFCYCVIRRSR